jgi:hypothetical protein
MSIETRNDSRFVKNYNFLNDYHLKNFTVFPEPVLVDGEIKTTTSMQLGTFGDGQKTYILPTYSKDIGKIENPLKYFSDLIKKGKIVGYEDVVEAGKQQELIRNKIIKDG